MKVNEDVANPKQTQSERRINILGINLDNLKDPTPRSILNLQNRYMKSIKMDENSILRCKIECKDLIFPMKFDTSKKNLSMIVLLDMGRVPTLNRYDDFFETSTFLYNPNLIGEKNHYVGLMIISKTRILSQIGCCFKGEKEKAEGLQSRTRNLIYRQDQTFKQVMKHGVNYDRFLRVNLDIDESLLRKKRSKNFILKNKRNAKKTSASL